MDYTTNLAYNLNKYQWDLIHNPASVLFSWLEEEEEGEAKCYGIFDDCEEILAILAKIRDTRISGKGIVIKKQADENFRRFTGKNIDIEKTEFKKVRIIYKPSKTEDIVFDPLNYYEVFKEQNLYADKNGNGVVEIQNGFVFKNKNNIECFRIIIDDEGDNYQTQKEILKKYLFGDGKPGDPIQEKINASLEYLKQFLGITYEQQCCENRTGMSETALEKMDCSEFACRYLQQVCGLTEVPAKTTTDLVTYIDKENDLMEFIEGSDEEEFKDIRPGDIFLWKRDDGTGHTGVVVSFNTTTDQVTVMEAISSSGSCEEGLSKAIEDYCKGCVRTSIYTRTGKSLINHKGWKGYFRPIVK